MSDPERAKLTQTQLIERNRWISINVTVMTDAKKWHVFIGPNRIISYNPINQTYSDKKGKRYFNFIFPRLHTQDDLILWNLPKSEDLKSGFGVCSPFSGLSIVISCQNCGKTIESDDPRRRYCSGACKREMFKKERRAPIWIQDCISCHKSIDARDGAKFCSHKCRMQYKRKK